MQLQLHTAPLKRLHRYSAPRPKAGLRAWEEATLPHDIGGPRPSHAGRLALLVLRTLGISKARGIVRSTMKDKFQSLHVRP